MLTGETPPLLLNPARRINRRATMATMHAREVFFTAFGVFCGRSTAPRTGPAYVLQRLQRFELSRVDGHVSDAYCVWTEDFFDNDFGSFPLSSSCVCSLSSPFSHRTMRFQTPCYAFEKCCSSSKPTPTCSLLKVNCTACGNLHPVTLAAGMSSRGGENNATSRLHFTENSSANYH